MYESFFELKCKPFSLLPDPDFLFLSSRHSIALSLLEYSLTGQAGFCVITGEIGSGKTTLVRAFLGRVGREFSVGLISNTHQQVRDIAGWALTAFGQKQTSTNPAEIYQELMAYLIAEYGAGRQCILIVDEAQNLSIEALEELRLLSNINSGKDLLLQILLVGQPELLDKLKQPELRQFAQRIAVSHHLSPLSFGETKKYVDHRLTIAGATKPVFTEMAIGAVQYFSGGVPRLINSICDLCLVYAFADGLREIDESLVFRVITDRQLSGIAPFAHSNPADDPAVRAEISVIARSDRPEAMPAEKPASARAEPRLEAPVLRAEPVVSQAKPASADRTAFVRTEPRFEAPAPRTEPVVPQVKPAAAETTAPAPIEPRVEAPARRAEPVAPQAKPAPARRAAPPRAEPRVEAPVPRGEPMVASQANPTRAEPVAPQVKPAAAEKTVSAPIEPRVEAPALRGEPMVASQAKPTRAEPPTSPAEIPQPIAITPRHMASAASGARPAANDETPESEESPDFDAEDADLLLTCEADDGDIAPAAPEAGARANGAQNPRVVVLHAEPSDRLPSASLRANDTKSDIEPQFSVSGSNRVGPTLGGHSLRVEETLLQAAPGGTSKPSERSWWRRAFRRGV